MKIKPSDKDVQTLLTSGFYVIPRFQRAYSWEGENITDFWNDVCLSTDEDYFIGSMVVYPEFEGSNIRYVVDGQQRLTTLTILLCGIRNALLKLDENDLAAGIQSLIERKDIDNMSRFVVLAETSYPYFQDHIQNFGTPDSEPEIGAEEKALELAMDLFTSNIASFVGGAKKSEAVKKLTSLRDKVLRLKVIAIELDNEDDAYLIFETLNTRGKDLEVSDLLKNLLTKLLKAKNTQNDTVKERWKKLTRTADSLGNDVDLNSFIHHHWLSYREYVAENKLFKSLKQSIKTKDEAQSYLTAIAKEIGFYRAILLPSEHKFKKEERKIKQSLTALQIFRVRQPIPTQLTILSTYFSKQLTKQQTEMIFDKLEKFHFLFTAITSQRSSGGISQMYSKAARDLRFATDKNARQVVLKELTGKLSQRAPSREEFLLAMSDVMYSEEFPREKNLVRYILEKFDAHYTKGVIKDYSQYTIEHIEPQSSQKLSSEDIASIGNLVLVPAELNNSQLSNKPFSEKKKLLETNNVPFDPILAKATKWNASTIEKRLHLLSQVAYDMIWRI